MEGTAKKATTAKVGPSKQSQNANKDGKMWVFNLEFGGKKV